MGLNDDENTTTHNNNQQHNIQTTCLCAVFRIGVCVGGRDGYFYADNINNVCVCLSDLGKATSTKRYDDITGNVVEYKAAFTRVSYRQNTHTTKMYL